MLIITLHSLVKLICIIDVQMFYIHQSKLRFSCIRRYLNDFIVEYLETYYYLIY